MNAMKACFKVSRVHIACSPLGSGAPQQLNRMGSRLWSQKVLDHILVPLLGV